MDGSGRTAVVAIGGNALLRGLERATIAEQFEAARKFAPALGRMVTDGWRLLLTHGNGPQVGFIQRRSDLVRDLAPELPSLALDMCVADSEGSLGYILASSLAAEFGDADVVALLTHTVVAAGDPAFARPAKPIGSFYTAERAAELAAEHGWAVTEDSGRGWRRLVPSPRPLRVVEERAVGTLLAGGFVVIAAGGGGIPVIEQPGGGYLGVEAVIDKDLTAALLARAVGADLLVITTSVERVAVDFGKPGQRYLDTLTADQARRYLADGQFPPGSMGPKVEAALQFAASGGEAIITSLEQLVEALDGTTGTRIM
jgi:carbamate kinase